MKTNSKSKRMLSLLLSLVMLLGMIPAMTMTASAAPMNTTEVDDFETLVSMLEKPGTAKIRLTDDVSGDTNGISVQGTKILDLNDYDIDANKDGGYTSTLFVIELGAKLTLTDSRGMGVINYNGNIYDGSSYDDGHMAIRHIFAVNGELVVNGGKIAPGRSKKQRLDVANTNGEGGVGNWYSGNVRNQVHGSGIIVNEGGKLTVNGGDIYGRGYQHLYVDGEGARQHAIYAGSGSTVIINDGRFIGKGGSNSVCVYHDADITVRAGIFDVEKLDYIRLPNIDHDIYDILGYVFCWGLGSNKDNCCKGTYGMTKIPERAFDWAWSDRSDVYVPSTMQHYPAIPIGQKILDLDICIGGDSTIYTKGRLTDIYTTKRIEIRQNDLDAERNRTISETGWKSLTENKGIGGGLEYSKGTDYNIIFQPSFYFPQDTLGSIRGDYNGFDNNPTTAQNVSYVYTLEYNDINNQPQSKEILIWDSPLNLNTVEWPESFNNIYLVTCVRREIWDGYTTKHISMVKSKSPIKITLINGFDVVDLENKMDFTWEQNGEPVHNGNFLTFEGIKIKVPEAITSQLKDGRDYVTFNWKVNQKYEYYQYTGNSQVLKSGVAFPLCGYFEVGKLTKLSMYLNIFDYPNSIHLPRDAVRGVVQYSSDPKDWRNGFSKDILIMPAITNLDETNSINNPISIDSNLKATVESQIDASKVKWQHSDDETTWQDIPYTGLTLSVNRSNPGFTCNSPSGAGFYRCYYQLVSQRAYSPNVIQIDEVDDDFRATAYFTDATSLTSKTITDANTDCTIRVKFPGSTWSSIVSNLNNYRVIYKLVQWPSAEGYSSSAATTTVTKSLRYLPRRGFFCDSVNLSDFYRNKVGEDVLLPGTYKIYAKIQEKDPVSGIYTAKKVTNTLTITYDYDRTVTDAKVYMCNADGIRFQVDDGRDAQVFGGEMLSIETTPFGNSVNEVKCEWGSSNPSAINVDSSGKISVLKPGEASIYVRISDADNDNSTQPIINKSFTVFAPITEVSFDTSFNIGDVVPARDTLLCSKDYYEVYYINYDDAGKTYNYDGEYRISYAFKPKAGYSFPFANYTCLPKTGYGDDYWLDLSKVTITQNGELFKETDTPTYEAKLHNKLWYSDSYPKSDIGPQIYTTTRYTKSPDKTYLNNLSFTLSLPDAGESKDNLTYEDFEPVGEDYLNVAGDGYCYLLARKLAPGATMEDFVRDFSLSGSNGTALKFDTFEAGYTYGVYVMLSIPTDKRDAYGFDVSDVTSYVNGDMAFTKPNGGFTNPVYSQSLYYTFTIGESIPVISRTYIVYDEPVAGAMPQSLSDYKAYGLWEGSSGELEYTDSIDVTRAQWFIDKNNNGKMDSYEGTAADFSNTGAFLGGKKYRLYTEITLNENSGYLMGTNTILHKLSADGNVTYNNGKISSISGYSPTNYATGAIDSDTLCGVLPEVTLESSGQIVSGSYKSFGDTSSQTFIMLMEEGTSKILYAADPTGNSGTYTISNVAPGTYTMLVAKTKHCAREYTITVGASDVTQDVEIWLYGDVNKSGSVDGSDATQIERFYAGKNSVFNSGDGGTIAYRKKVANVNGITNGNPTVDNSDATQIYRYYAGKSSVFNSIP